MLQLPALTALSSAPPNEFFATLSHASPSSTESLANSVALDSAPVKPPEEERHLLTRWPVLPTQYLATISLRQGSSPLSLAH
jgi:hypothetical protein